MGRTQPTFRLLLDRLEQEWSDYRRGLRRREAEAYRALWQKARAHASASTNAARVHPMEAVFMSVLLEHEQELRRLRARVAALEPDAAPPEGEADGPGGGRR